MADEGWRDQQELKRDLNAAKRKALAVVEAPAVEQQWFRDAADDLAAVLARLHEDDKVWESLRSGQVTLAALHAADRPDVRMVLDVDFTSFLEAADYEEPPPVDAYAWSFKVDVVRALHEPDRVDLERLRDRIGDLARRLASEGPDGRSDRRDAWVAALRHGAGVAGRAALIAAIAASTTVVMGPLVATFGAGFASVILEATKGASTAALEDVVPPLPTRDIERIGPTASDFDLAATRVGWWVRPERLAAQKAQLKMLRVALDSDDELTASRLQRQQIRWASGALAAALLAGEAGRTTSPMILPEVDAMADVLAKVLDAVVELDLSSAEQCFDLLTGPEISVLEYDAHDVPEPTRKAYPHRAARGDAGSLDRLAIDGVPYEVGADVEILTEINDNLGDDPHIVVW